MNLLYEEWMFSRAEFFAYERIAKVNPAGTESLIQVRKWFTEFHEWKSGPEIQPVSNQKKAVRPFSGTIQLRRTPMWLSISDPTHFTSYEIPLPDLALGTQQSTWLLISYSWFLFPSYCCPIWRLRHNNHLITGYFLLTTFYQLFFTSYWIPPPDLALHAPRSAWLLITDYFLLTTIYFLLSTKLNHINIPANCVIQRPCIRLTFVIWEQEPQIPPEQNTIRTHAAPDYSLLIGLAGTNQQPQLYQKTSTLQF